MADLLPYPIFDHVFLGMELRAWLTLVVLWAIVASLLLVVRRIAIHYTSFVAKRTTTDWDDVLVELLRQTRSYFLIATALVVVTLAVLVEGVAGKWIAHIAFLIFLLQIIVWGHALIGMYVTRFRERKMETDAAAVTTVQAIGLLTRVGLWAIVVLAALDNFGFDVGTLLAGLGIGGIAIALATQNMLADLFASLSIVLDKPFVVGDFVNVGDMSGTVQHIGLKTTRVRSLSGEQIVFSNSDLLSSRIRNYKRMEERRVAFTVGVTYGTDAKWLQEISRFLRESVEAQETARFDRAHFKGYGDFSLIYEVVYYVLSSDYAVYMDTQQAINIAIHKAFTDRDIEFAFPTQSLFIEKLPERQVQDVNGGEVA